ncbi:hypothetical protein E2C01_084216 [Portunus trituberculatus]|uniref:Uncharacterized protein n=1 Tax=Portunus trituberculatus TaxID=210409 RepID=A0A5B7J8N2_PORTR|nr:hypothetical protein [Portunus trituberculatus]
MEEDGGEGENGGNKEGWREGRRATQELESPRNCVPRVRKLEQDSANQTPPRVETHTLDTGGSDWLPHRRTHPRLKHRLLRNHGEVFTLSL